MAEILSKKCSLILILKIISDIFFYSNNLYLYVPICGKINATAHSRILQCNWNSLEEIV